MFALFDKRSQPSLALNAEVILLRDSHCSPECVASTCSHDKSFASYLGRIIANTCFVLSERTVHCLLTSTSSLIDANTHQVTCESAVAVYSFR